MTTITINERTKAGKALLELANLLATNNKGVTINVGLGKPAVKVLSANEKKYLSNLKKVAKDVRENYKSKKFQTLDSFLNEV